MVKYIIRLDDACPTMDWGKWNRMFDLLDKYNIKPIIAVIPNNEDKSLIISEPKDNFWETVKIWEKKGYNIAIHGYNHVYTSKEKGLVPINDRSEFAGVSVEKQTIKIEKAWNIFKSNNITPKIWVAPAHSFDKNTLVVLKEKTDIRIISDGLALKPFKRFGFLWIPQQLWKPKKRKFGVWTICYHPNNMTKDDFVAFERFIKIYQKYFIFNFWEFVKIFVKRNMNILDYSVFLYFLFKSSLKRILKVYRYLIVLIIFSYALY